jgi:hypothetical protein
MRSPALALGWELWRRHRHILTALLAWFFATALVSVTVPIEPLAVPLYAKFLMACAFIYAPAAVAGALVAIFCRTESAELLLLARSGVPTRMFSLPVSTAALVFWPMCYGTASMMLLWLLVVLLMAWPQGVAAPLLAPAFGLAAALAWAQAVIWIPFRLGLLRMLYFYAVVCLLGLIPVLALPTTLGLGTGTLAVLYAGALAAAYVQAYVGVARARRGDDPQWRWLDRLGAWWESWQPRRRRPFTSAAQAFVWMEWRRYGFLLPGVVGFYLLVALIVGSIIWVAELQGQPKAGHTFPTIAGLRPETCEELTKRVVPVLMLVFVGAIWGFGFVFPGPKRPALSTFYATRPLSSAALAGLEFRLAARSILVTWAIFLPFLVLFSLWPGSGREAFLEVRAVWLPDYTTVEWFALLLLLLGISALLTWAQMVRVLVLVFTGQKKFITNVMLTGMLGFVALGVVLYFPISREAFRSLLPWLLAAALLLKAFAAAWAARAALRHGLLSVQDLKKLGGLWCLGVCVLVALLVWLLPVWLVVGAVVLEMPLARLIAAPLALAWNRHR